MHKIHLYTHCLHHQDHEEALVQEVESLKRFQVRFEVLHRSHLNQWACAFWHLANHSAALLQQFSFSFVVDPVFVSLLVLVVTLSGRSLRFCGSTVAESSSASCEDGCGGVRSRGVDLSFRLERPLCSADGGWSVAGDEGFISEKSSSDTSSASVVTIG